MIEINSSYIPSLSKNLSISPFDSVHYLVCIDQEPPVKLKITQTIKLLIDQMDGIKNIEEITQEFNRASGANMTVESVIKIIQDQLAGFGILKNDLREKIKTKDNYLKLRMTIFPRNMVWYMVSPFLFLFDKATFKYTLLICISFLTIAFIYKLNLARIYANISVDFMAWFIGVNLLSIVLHELGHAGACEKYGAKTGPIGLGFYLFTPVFFTDVSDAWRLKKNERLIVDLAGIYMQLIFCSILACIYFLSQNEFYLHIAFLISITVFITLNPFLRYDGYWAVTDLLNVTNLRETSNKILKQLLKRLLGKSNTWNSSWKNIFLAVYGIASSIFILYFLVALIVYERSSILYFPVNLLHFVNKLLTDSSNITGDWIKLNLVSFISPFIFYVLLYKMIKNKINPLKSFKV